MPTNNEIQDLARSFVNSLSRSTKLTRKKREVICRILEITDYEFSELSNSYVPGNKSDSDYICLNPLSKIVISTGDKVEVNATRFINSLAHFTHPLSSKSKEENIDEVAKKITKAIPFYPIVLTEHGDRMVSPRYSHTFHRPTDDDKLGPVGLTTIGRHNYCGGSIERRGATADRDVLLCTHCYLRVRFPKKVKTYGELRRALGFPSL